MKVCIGIWLILIVLGLLAKCGYCPEPFAASLIPVLIGLTLSQSRYSAPIFFVMFGISFYMFRDYTIRQQLAKCHHAVSGGNVDRSHGTST